jgi:hypothetical protein
MSIGTALLAVLTDPTYGIPLVVAIALTAGVGWWSLQRMSSPPTMRPPPGPEVWRMQLDALVYASLSQGRYSAAVDGLGRCLAVAVRNRFHVNITRPEEFNDPELIRVLPGPLTIEVLVRDLNRAYTSATWAEESSWLARRWRWLQRRQQRRAARDFAVLTHAVTTALTAFEVA